VERYFDRGNDLLFLQNYGKLPSGYTSGSLWSSAQLHIDS
jgi:hypothetical protein